MLRKEGRVTQEQPQVHTTNSGRTKTGWNQPKRGQKWK